MELPGLSAAMQAVKKGERRRILLEAAEACGLYDPRLTAVVSRRSLRCEPLAGQDLIFEVHVTDARDATARELSEAGQPEAAPYLH